MACDNENAICCGACFVEVQPSVMVGKTIKSAHVAGDLFVLEATDGAAFSTKFTTAPDHLIFFTGCVILGANVVDNQITFTTNKREMIIQV